MKATRFTESKYLSAKMDKASIDGKKFTIDAVFPEVINGTEKLCARLRGVEKVLVLNQTNIAVLVQKYGDETDLWVNQVITLNVIGIMFNGSLVDGIQVRA